MKKSIWILAIAVVLGAVIFMNLDSAQVEPPLVAADGEEKVLGAADATASLLEADPLTGRYGLAGVRWIFSQISEGDGLNAPVTQARVQPLGVTHPDGRAIEVATWRLGNYQGSCAEIAKPADEAVAAIAYAQCWWAGGGNQFRAVRDGNILRIDVRDVDEEESAPAMFKQLSVINLATIVE